MPKKSLVIEIENLVKKNNDLFDELTAVKRKNEESKALIATLVAMTEQLEKELDAKNEEISELKTALEKENVENKMSETENIAVETSDDAIDGVATVEVEDPVDILSNSPEVTVKANERVSINTDYGAAVELASAAIGEVVLECTELCAFFAENGGSNAKDLINLALGRTEVFKGEALGIIEESDDTSYTVSQLGEKKGSTLEYFKLLKKQV
ncbi:MAG: hypothetical protein E7525_05575 [Ruminococcaceae bacterium]|nr:hypothetical protein [Oscillospiraceae bacterium]